MTVRERIAKLEAILARVTSRAGAPRATNGAGPATHAAEVSAHADAPVVSSEPITPIDVEVSELTEPSPQVVPAQAVLEPPPRLAHPVEAESRERMIAAPEREPEPSPSSVEPVSAEVSQRPSAAAPETVESDSSEGPEITVAEVSDAPDLGEAADEEPPVSSRRPIALEAKLDELAFGEGAPPEQVAHTPPPESGRQVAAPAVDLDFEGEFTGVRPKEPEAGGVTVVAQAAKPKAPAAPLVAETTKAASPASQAASFEGAAPAFKPSTFGELLDATLSL